MSNRVWGFAQDAKGFIWIGTGQLNKYDGRQFLNGNNTDDPAFHLKEWDGLTASGELIYGVGDYAIKTLNINTGEISIETLMELHMEGYIIIKGMVTKTPDGSIIVPLIQKDKNGVIFIRMVAGHKHIIGPIRNVDYTYDARIIRFAGDAQGHLYYVDKQKNLIEIDANGVVLNRKPLDVKDFWYNILIPDKKTILLSKSDSLFISKNGSPFRPHDIHNRNLKKSKAWIKDLFMASDGKIWLVGDNKYLSCYDPKTGEFQEFVEDLDKLLPFNLNLVEIHEDNTGSLWVKTVMGLIKIMPKKSIFTPIFSDEPEICRGYCSFRGITENSEGKIIAGYYGSYIEFDPVSGETSLLDPDLNHAPWGLISYKGNLFINDGTVFDFQNIKRINPFNSTINTNANGLFGVDDNNRLWWTCYRRIHLLDELQSPNSWKLVHEEDRVEQVNIELFQFDFSRNLFWVTMTNDLYTFDPASYEFNLWKPNSERSAFIPRSMLLNEDGSQWLGTETGLLHYFPEQDSFLLYTTSNGLPNNYICGILPEGDSALWLATNNGLSRFDLQSEIFTNFYIEDGLPHNEFNRASSYLSEAGDYYFGTLNGIVKFRPEDYLKSGHSSSNLGTVELVNFSKSDEKANEILHRHFFPDDFEIELRYRNKSVEFEYALTDYSSTLPVNYSYILEGQDNYWSDPSEINVARYNNLPAGEYTFKVKALNAKGHWNKNELAIPVKVYPPWFKTWWAYLSYALLVLGTGFIVWRFLMKRIQLKHQLELEKEEAHRLKDLDTFKSRVYTNITHEFRTPLTVIMGMANRIKEEPKEFLGEGLELIERNGKNMLTLVNQLLDLSKLEDKSFKLNLKYGDVISFLHYLTGSFQSVANQENLSLKFRTTIEALKMDFDAEQLQQIMVNLLSNAIKFTPSGGEVIVWVKPVEMSDGDQNFVQVEVIDSGVGIPAHDLPHIFERFFQADNSTTRTAEGTGIGLAHAAELVKLMGGEVKAKSTLGVGSSIGFTLPVRKELKDSQDRRQQGVDDWSFDKPLAVSSSNANQSITEVGEAKVDLPHLLIVEDNPDVVTYLKSCLKKEYQLDVAFNGRIGVEKALESIPDLIISDVMMPEKDGYQLCNELKTNELTSHIPIVMLTAKADTDSRITGLEQGADAYLSKPFNRKELLVRLSKLNEQRKRLTEKFRQIIHNPAVENPAVSKNPKENAFVQKIKEILENKIEDENFGLPGLCEEVGMSRTQLFRKLKALAGTSPSAFIRTFRLQKAKQLLESSTVNVSEAAYQTGFRDPSYFSKLFQEEFGHQPSSYIQSQ